MGALGIYKEEIEETGSAKLSEKGEERERERETQTRA